MFSFSAADTHELKQKLYERIKDHGHEFRQLQKCENLHYFL